MAEHIDMPVANWREVCDIFIIHGFPLFPEMIQGILHIFTDKASGSSVDRPEIDLLRMKVEEGDAIQ